MIPSYMLGRVYVKGSLKNVEGGYEFLLRNNVDSGTIIGIGPVAVDGTDCSPATLAVVTTRGERRGDQITSQAPMYASVGMDIRIHVQGDPLAAGAHRVVFAVMTREAGRLQIEFEDSL